VDFLGVGGIETSLDFLFDVRFPELFDHLAKFGLFFVVEEFGDVDRTFEAVVTQVESFVLFLRIGLLNYIMLLGIF
jgi:hypothetical protein